MKRVLIIIGIILSVIMGGIFLIPEESKTTQSWDGFYEFDNLDIMDTHGNMITDVECTVTNDVEQSCEYYFKNGTIQTFIRMSPTSSVFPIKNTPNCGADTLLIGGIVCVVDNRVQLNPSS